jgi:hypothetical protein
LTPKRLAYPPRVADEEVPPESPSDQQNRASREEVPPEMEGDEAEEEEEAEQGAGEAEAEKTGQPVEDPPRIERAGSTSHLMSSIDVNSDRLLQIHPEMEAWLKSLKFGNPEEFWTETKVEEYSRHLAREEYPPIAGMERLPKLRDMPTATAKMTPLVMLQELHARDMRRIALMGLSTVNGLLEMRDNEDTPSSPDNVRERATKGINDIVTLATALAQKWYRNAFLERVGVSKEVASSSIPPEVSEYVSELQKKEESKAKARTQMFKSRSTGKRLKRDRPTPRPKKNLSGGNTRKASTGNRGQKTGGKRTRFSTDDSKSKNA